MQSNMVAGADDCPKGSDTAVTVKVVFVLGPPGSGRRTQSVLLESVHGFVHISLHELALKAAGRRRGNAAIRSALESGDVLASSFLVPVLEDAMKPHIEAGRDRFVVEGVSLSMDNINGFKSKMPDGITCLFLVLSSPEAVCVQRLCSLWAKTNRRATESLLDQRAHAVYQLWKQKVKPAEAEFVKKFEGVKIPTLEQKRDVFVRVQAGVRLLDGILPSGVHTSSYELERQKLIRELEELESRVDCVGFRVAAQKGLPHYKAEEPCSYSESRHAELPGYRTRHTTTRHCQACRRLCPFWFNPGLYDAMPTPSAVPKQRKDIAEPLAAAGIYALRSGDIYAIACPDDTEAQRLAMAREFFYRYAEEADWAISACVDTFHALADADRRRFNDELKVSDLELRKKSLPTVQELLERRAPRIHVKSPGQLDAEMAKKDAVRGRVDDVAAGAVDADVEAAGEEAHAAGTPARANAKTTDQGPANANTVAETKVPSNAASALMEQDSEKGQGALDESTEETGAKRRTFEILEMTQGRLKLRRVQNQTQRYVVVQDRGHDRIRLKKLSGSFAHVQVDTDNLKVRLKRSAMKLGDLKFRIRRP